MDSINAEPLKPSGLLNHNRLLLALIVQFANSMTVFFSDKTSFILDYLLVAFSSYHDDKNCSTFPFSIDVL